MLRLLIVDDEYGIRSGIASYFPWAGLGIEVGATCQDGSEALAHMAKSRFDLVLCDVRMPRIDGIRFAEILRERRYPCEIVFISAHKDFEYAKRAIELGVRNYIVKPAGYEELHEVFSRLARELRGDGAGESRGEADREPRGEASRDARGQVPGAEERRSGPASGGIAGRAALLIERDLGGISLKSAARELGLSPNHLSARLRRETGKTFSELLAATRMARARELLADRANRVRDVGAMVGYASEKSFMRAFKDYFGTSPSRFRGKADA